MLLVLLFVSYLLSGGQMFVHVTQQLSIRKIITICYLTTIITTTYELIVRKGHAISG